MKLSKSVATIIVITIFVCFIHGARFLNGYSKKSSSISTRGARTLGNPKAEVHIIEYTDLQCPACAKASTLLKKYLKDYPSQIYFEYRHYPIINLHPHALRVSIYAECAARQNRFWEFHDAAFKNRHKLQGNVSVEGRLTEIAMSVGLNFDILSVCLEDKMVRSSVLREKSEGHSMGVRATPTYFVNGKMVVGPYPLAEELKNILGKKKDENL